MLLTNSPHLTKVRTKAGMGVWGGMEQIKEGSNQGKSASQEVMSSGKC